MFKEYPKMLYKTLDNTVIAHTKSEEDDKINDGWQTSPYEEVLEVKRVKRGRKPKNELD